MLKCPYCGWQFTHALAQLAPLGPGLTPPHETDGNECPGSNQYPRLAASDRRPLWRELPKEDR